MMTENQLREAWENGDFDDSGGGRPSFEEILAARQELAENQDGTISDYPELQEQDDGSEAVFDYPELSGQPDNDYREDDETIFDYPELEQTAQG
jgi:hypothetical protein